jgi:hypothetical protein
MKLLVLHRRSALRVSALLLSAAAFALPAAPHAQEGIKIGAAGWSQISVVGNSSDTAGGADHNGKSALSYGAQISLGSRVSDKLSIATGVGLAAGHSMFSMPGDPTGYAPLGIGAYVSEANFTYNFGSQSLFLRGGMFSYIYNPDVKNLGLYLLRGPVYPGFVVSGFETKHVLPVANMIGLQLHHEIGNFRQDFILSSETEFYPYFDLSPAYVAGYRPHPSLDLGAGVNFYHYIPVDGKLTTDKSYNYVQGDSAGNPVDTINISFRGIKLMARASFDPKAFFDARALGPEDLKLYGEVALIGLDNSDAHKDMYGELRQRMPVMFGVNLPVFRALDHLSFEMEWYGAPFHDDMEPYLTGYNKPTPFPVGWYGTPTRNNNADQNVTRDNWKWSLHGARMIQDHVRLSFQVASDHWRPGIYRGDGDTKLAKRQSIMVTPEDWYFTTKLAYFF